MIQASLNHSSKCRPNVPLLSYRDIQAKTTYITLRMVQIDI